MLQNIFLHVNFEHFAYCCENVTWKHRYFPYFIVIAITMCVENDFQINLILTVLNFKCRPVNYIKNTTSK